MSSINVRDRFPSTPLKGDLVACKDLNIYFFKIPHLDRQSILQQPRKEII